MGLLISVFVGIMANVIPTSAPKYCKTIIAICAPNIRIIIACTNLMVAVNTAGPNQWPSFLDIFVTLTYGEKS